MLGTTMRSAGNSRVWCRNTLLYRKWVCHPYESY